MRWDGMEQKLPWDGMEQKNMSHGQPWLLMNKDRRPYIQGRACKISLPYVIILI